MRGEGVLRGDVEGLRGENVVVVEVVVVGKGVINSYMFVIVVDIGLMLKILKLLGFRSCFNCFVRGERVPLLHRVVQLKMFYSCWLRLAIAVLSFSPAAHVTQTIVGNRASGLF